MTTKHYAAHLKPIDFNLLPIPNAVGMAMHLQHAAPATPASVQFVWLASKNSNSTETDLGLLHQQFLHQQATIYQLYLQQHALLSQQLHQQLAPKEISQKMIPEPTIANEFPGPQFSREDLEGLASSNISTYFGEWFKPLDKHAKLIRMPQPPLLLTDKILGIAGEPGSMGKGSIWTETTVAADAWYIHEGRMPAGIMIEAGQSDLLLASWLGFDLHNQGQRAYRLLGCEASYHGELPKVGDTLRYDIHIDGHVRQGEVIMFFFHYDCHINGELRLKVRHGQAGFFSEQELKDSGGVLWDAHTAATPSHEVAHQQASLITQNKTFSAAQLKYFSEGRIAECFGKDFDVTDCHTRTPKISQDQMLLIDEITHFDAAGGPWQRGYMRAVQHIQPDDWFFKGHFKNDPCMPGTLILEGALQTMACYLTALGCTLNKDGWRFEPVTEVTYKMRCRGQVIPSSTLLEYEIFIYSFTNEPHPTIMADILCTADGLKAFHTRCGLRLVPDWPIDVSTIPITDADKQVASVNGFRFDYRSLLACAVGRPSTAFGDFYRVFDSERRVARLPGPPYHFMSRVTAINGEMGCFKPGVSIECEYDIPHNAWYFASNTNPVMPFSVLLEIGLQPCGWLASFIGSALTSNRDLKFRNLEGVAKFYRDVTPEMRTLRVCVVSKSVSPSAGMIIEAFDVQVYAEQELIFTMDTVFGFFPENAFANQAGLASSAQEKEWLTEPANVHLDLKALPRDHFSSSLQLPKHDLLMLDRVTGIWPNHEQKNLGRIRAEKEVHASDWFFKAHFFQDPVQPGSLGMEAIYQLLEIYLLQQGLHTSFKQPQCSFWVKDKAVTWKYRGQVVPSNQCVTILLDIVQCQHANNVLIAETNASLWVDGKKIYETQLGVTISERPSAAKNQSFQINPAQEPWVLDHCPNYVMPVLPLMSMMDLLGQAASLYFPGKKLIRMQQVRAHDWAIINQPISLQPEVLMLNENNAEVNLHLIENNLRTKIASGQVCFANEYPTPPALELSVLLDAELDQSPYDKLFHGPALQGLETLYVGSNGSSAILRAENEHVPFGCLNQALLDGSIHTVPNEQLTRWSNQLPGTHTSLPTFITDFCCYQTPPQTGEVRCETRFKGFYLQQQFFQVEISLFVGDALWIHYTLINVLLPKGKLGNLPHMERRAFLRDRQYTPSARLSTVTEDGQFHLTAQEVKEIDWIPGSVAKLYNVTGDYETMAKQISLKEVLAEQNRMHPSKINLSNG